MPETILHGVRYGYEQTTRRCGSWRRSKYQAAAGVFSRMFYTRRTGDRQGLFRYRKQLDSAKLSPARGVQGSAGSQKCRSECSRFRRTCRSQPVFAREGIHPFLTDAKGHNTGKTCRTADRPRREFLVREWVARCVLVANPAGKETRMDDRSEPGGGPRWTPAERPARASLLYFRRGANEGQESPAGKTNGWGIRAGSGRSRKAREFKEG